MPHSSAAPCSPLTRALSRGAWHELSVTIFRNSDPGPYSELGAVLDGLPADGQVVRADVFGPPAPLALDCPITWVCPISDESPHLGGVYLQVAVDAAVTPVQLDGRLVGSVIRTPEAVEFIAAGIGPADPHAEAPHQARQTFERMEQALELAGMDFSNVVRTWLFLDDILSWYREFNAVRTAFFTERGVFDGMVPASTGIGGPNPDGWAIMTGLLAVKPLSDRVGAQAVPSPLQCPAPKYGSSFSRAVEVNMGDHRRLLISGTASIGPDGNTVHIGDIAGQVARTMEVVGAILESRGMGWGDVTRAIAYVLDPADAQAFERYRREHDLMDLPVLTAHDTICRADLLFELELDAVADGPRT